MSKPIFIKVAAIGVDGMDFIKKSGDSTFCTIITVPSIGNPHPPKSAWYKISAKKDSVPITESEYASILRRSLEANYPEAFAPLVTPP
jgi:hypothetical protein